MLKDMDVPHTDYWSIFQELRLRDVALFVFFALLLPALWLSGDAPTWLLVLNAFNLGHCGERLLGRR